MTSIKRSLSELVIRAETTLISKTGQDNPANRAIAAAIAGLSYGNYAYQDMLFKELHPETCSEQWLYLHASRHDCPRQAPSFAYGFVRFEQLDGVVEIPAKTKLSLNSLEFEVIEKSQSDRDVVVVALQFGSESNLKDGAILTLDKALSGVNPSKVLSLGFGGGADLEDIDSWRKRVISAYKKSLVIGRAEDYELWAVSSHQDIDFAYCLDNTPAIGMLEIYVGKYAVDPTLSDQVVEIATDFINEKRLAGCHPVVKIPSHIAVDIEIQGIDDEASRIDAKREIDSLIISKMGKYADGNLESITPTEIILAVNKVTSQFILKRPTDSLSIENHQIFVTGSLSWI